MRYLGYKRLS